MVLKLFNKDKVYLPGQQIVGYTVLELLGEGRYGICYLVSEGDRQYILKQLKREMLKKIGHKVSYEKEILRSIQHDSIPRYIKKLEFDDFFGYVLEFKEGKTFEEIIYKDNYTFKREEIYDIGMQIINILKYLHSKGIVHRDIRVPNTLFNNGNVYLVDFGLARWANNEKYKLDVDFSYFGDFLLHLHYTSFEGEGAKAKPWYEELQLTENEVTLLKRLLGIEERYKSIEEIEVDFLSI
ncbi:MAG: protein kinase family protein [Clostridia bacterium]|nr:protein kinase family protein [Clostridia bacterium]